MSVHSSLSSHRRRLRVAGLQGLIFAVLYQVGNSALASLPGAPGGDEVDDDVARHFFDNSGGVLTSAAVVAVSAACLVWVHVQLPACSSCDRSVTCLSLLRAQHWRTAKSSTVVAKT